MDHLRLSTSRLPSKARFGSRSTSRHSRPFTTLDRGSAMTAYRRMASLKTATEFRDYQRQLDIDVPLDELLVTGEDAPLGRAFNVDNFIVGNRFAILPMEGWDGTLDGK